MPSPQATMSGPGLAEGAERLPYFFAHVTAVLCPKCAEDAPEPEKLNAVYTASRLYMCGRCGIYIGPTDEEEAGRA